MPIDPQAWPEISRLMDEWMDLPEERREEWFAGVTAAHPELAQTLRKLLSQPKPEFLHDLPHVDVEYGALSAGMLAGPYRLEKELGRGGMGVVWLATRADGAVSRKVAIKFPFLHLYDDAVKSRFAREREILGRLEDARIARLYDAGVTAQGQPYLVLEYVEGEEIIGYCDRLRLDIRARLRLFLEVLRGVQYAHANLVVHRDLKPSNILVTAAGEVRLLDFGIAKFLEDGETAETEITRLGGRALTPGYASPEQVRGDAITTATDVYSLGVLLCDLLTGSRPRAGARPSFTQFSQASAWLRAGASPKSLAAALRGDLDTIILKAVQDEPGARYSTADAFAQDIDRYLSGQPVLARPESAWYRTRKFVQRNKLGVSAAIAIVLAIGVGGTVAMWQKRRADTEAATARAVSDFLQKDLLAQAGSQSQAALGTRPDPDIKVRTALDRAAQRLDGKFPHQPVVEAAIRQTIGDTYSDLGLYAEAERQMSRALSLRERVLGGTDIDTLKSTEMLASVYQAEGKYAAAEALLQKLVQQERSHGRAESREAIDAAHTLARIAALGRADYPSAESQYRKVVEIERRVLGESDAETLVTMNDLAATLARERKFAEAEDLYRKVVEIKRSTMGDAHPSTLSSMNGLAVLYRNEGNYAEAETWFRQALDGRRRSEGPTHRDTLSSMGGLGLLYMAEGKYGEAEPLLTEVVNTAGRVLGDDNPDTQTSLNNLADLYAREGRFKEADAAFSRLLNARLKTYGADNGFTAGTWSSLGDVKLQLGAFADAGTLLQKAVEHYQRHKIDTWRVYYTECLLGASLAGQGRNAEGKAMLSRAYQNLLARKDSVPPEYRGYLDRAAKVAGITK